MANRVFTFRDICCETNSHGSEPVLIRIFIKAPEIIKVYTNPGALAPDLMSRFYVCFLFDSLMIPKTVDPPLRCLREQAKIRPDGMTHNITGAVCIPGGPSRQILS